MSTSQQNNFNDNQCKFEQELPDHHYRTEIPNIIFDLGLDTYTFSVYAKIKRISGDSGKCWQSIPNLASSIGMSVSKLKECLKQLEKGHNKLKLSLIKKTTRKNEDGADISSVYTIVNIWPLNGKYFRGEGSPQN